MRERKGPRLVGRAASSERRVCIEAGSTLPCEVILSSKPGRSCALGARRSEELTITVSCRRIAPKGPRRFQECHRIRAALPHQRDAVCGGIPTPEICSEFVEDEP
ncbi:hypothetical protein R1flu_022552 [Riccia fluitans]|uniref:Uncharacterized protein n=1 Tax=Riccia fluitans TaxID=41844 RepID=A0ABD1XPK9_9MARC